MPPGPAAHRIVRLPETTSSNDVARRGVEEGAFGVGTVVVAERQTAGRGRRSRVWITIPGRSLAASIVVAPPALHRPARLGLLAAVAAARALERLGVRDVAIKWPNDLMRGEAKIGGLLLETAQPPAGAPLLVVGVGINLAVRPGDVPPELAGCVGGAGLPDGAGSREALLSALLEELDAALAEVGTPADELRGAELRRRSWLTGREAQVRVGRIRRAVRIADVTADGDLVATDGSLLRGELVELLSVGPAVAGPGATGLGAR